MSEGLLDTIADTLRNMLKLPKGQGSEGHRRHANSLRFRITDTLKIYVEPRLSAYDVQGYDVIPCENGVSVLKGKDKAALCNNGAVNFSISSNLDDFLVYVWSGSTESEGCIMEEYAAHKVCEFSIVRPEARILVVDNDPKKKLYAKLRQCAKKEDIVALAPNYRFLALFGVSRQILERKA